MTLLFQEGTENGGERPHAAEVQGPGLDRADRRRGQAEGQGHQVHEEGAAEAPHASRGQIEQAPERHLSDCAPMSSIPPFSYGTRAILNLRTPKV